MTSTINDTVLQWASWITTMVFLLHVCAVLVVIGDRYGEPTDGED